MIIVPSVNGVPIRLTQERWAHIVRNHPEMDGWKDTVLDTLAHPDMVQEGDYGALIALGYHEETVLGSKWMVVIYKETDVDDGFVLTAYFTSKPSVSRRVVWRR
ncbi:MAG: hypothetical protein HZC51_13180 [Nitrospirae bacterium]|nr:hypothetical protein [Nitrospirota bacterium]